MGKLWRILSQHNLKRSCASFSSSRAIDELRLSPTIQKRIALFELIRTKQHLHKWLAYGKTEGDCDLNPPLEKLRIEVTRDQALEIFSDNHFQVEIIKGLPEEKTIPIYRWGLSVGLGQGPHFVKASSCLEEYEDMQEEAKKYDYKSELYYLPRGTLVFNKLMHFMRDQYDSRDYHEADMEGYESEPMTFTEHCLVFAYRDRSYSELPRRVVDLGELSRELDDAHIVCRQSQVKDEVKGSLEFMSYVYGTFGLTFDLKLSTRPKKYIRDIEKWDRTEKSLVEALNEFGKPWQINEAGGAFCGPKIDISVSDAMGRNISCAKLQLDFKLPSRFKLTGLAKDESKREKPVLIHMNILGSFKNMYYFLLEHYEGKWPFWLSPRQAIVCPVSDKSQPYGLELHGRLRRAGFQVEIDESDKTIQKKVEEAESVQCNYILVVGEEECNTKQVRVRVRGNAVYTMMNVDDLLQRFKGESMKTSSLYAKRMSIMRRQFSNNEYLL